LPPARQPNLQPEILDVLFDPVFIRDFESARITFFNRSAETLYGWTAAEAVGQVAGDLLQTRFPVREADVLQALVTTGHWEGRLIQRARDGSEVTVDARWALLGEPDAPESILEVNADARPSIERELEAARRSADYEEGLARAHSELASGSARQRELAGLKAELEREVAARTASLVLANQELESFAYAVSHDLRTPLRALAGFSQALEEDYSDVLDAEGRDYVDRIQRAARRLGLLIDSFLVLSRLSRQTARKQAVDLSQLTAEVLSDLREAAPERAVDCVIEPELTASADPALMLVLLQNLIGNAWKFTSRSPRARIELGRTDTEQGSAFFVRDDGIGFDMARAQRLFEPFQRLHRASDFEGTGIGLATVQRVVRLHGGRVWAEAAPGAGATFYFTIPEADAETG